MAVPARVAVGRDHQILNVKLRFSFTLEPYRPVLNGHMLLDRTCRDALSQHDVRYHAGGGRREAGIRNGGDEKREESSAKSHGVSSKRRASRAAEILADSRPCRPI